MKVDNIDSVGETTGYVHVILTEAWRIKHGLTEEIHSVVVHHHHRSICPQLTSGSYDEKTKTYRLCLPIGYVITLDYASEDWLSVDHYTFIVMHDGIFPPYRSTVLRERLNRNLYIKHAVEIRRMNPKLSDILERIKNWKKERRWTTR